MAIVGREETFVMNVERIAWGFLAGLLFFMMMTALQRAAVVEAREDSLVRLHEVEIVECRKTAENCDDALVTCIAWQTNVNHELAALGSLIRSFIPSVP
jgi:hypothetical protein